MMTMMVVDGGGTACWAGGCGSKETEQKPLTVNL